MSEHRRLFESDPGDPGGGAFVDPADEAARRFAVDPRRNVVLEASAGTGKTRVLVERYLNLLRAGVGPSNVLAITFTRKAAAEMHERIVRRLREEAALSPDGRRRWLDLRDRLGEIAISTIDAFCLSLLREFPLEADLDPGFEVADETEVPRLAELAIDRTLRIAIHRAPQDPDLTLILAQLGTTKARAGLSRLIERRLVARGALKRFLDRTARDLTLERACERARADLRALLDCVPGGLERFLADGPVRHPKFQLLARTLRGLAALAPPDTAAVRSVIERAREHFITQEGKARTEKGSHPPYSARHGDSDDAWRRHRRAVTAAAPRVVEILTVFDRDLNALLARGVRKLFEIAEAQYRRALDERSVLDFADLVDRALGLLRQMDEFAQSRFRLESRYHHVLVDEFQDTSRAQWELVEQLIKSWGEGFGLVHDAPLQPSIFVVGDRKQSIYRFRDAEVRVLDEAAAFIDSLRPEGCARRSIRQSLRAVPELLAFVNDLCQAIEKAPARTDAFRYDESDEFPIDERALAKAAAGPVLGLAAADDPERSAAAVADEIVRLCREGTVRDRQTGVARDARPSDIAILFRSRVSHREFEEALGARGVPAYVYKGLGFFDADEIKDLAALMRYLADPSSDLRAAAFLRSRVVRLSDAGLARLAPRLAATLTSPSVPPVSTALSDEDQHVLAEARRSVSDWLALVDRIPPADLVDQILAESAYAFELRGPRRLQAWENVKKLRSLVRRIQNRGYATLARIAEYLDCLHAGDESNAVLEALEAVNLMTVHAAKGLEFPIVFIVNLAKGVGAQTPPVRVIEDAGGEARVTVGRYVPDADEDERAKDREETKRLLYVALTRARDRLYLVTALKDGRLTPGPGSLAGVLPGSFASLFEAAAHDAASDTTEWPGASGRQYRLRVCRPVQNATLASVPSALVRTPRGPDDFSQLSADPARDRLPVTGLVETDDVADAKTEPLDAGERRIAGTLVHRLFRQWAPIEDEDALRRRAASLVRPDEFATLVNVSRVIEEAAATYAAMRARDEVRALMEDGERHFEVPFSLISGRTIVRGTIDCLVERPDGAMVVLDFKTGREHPGHRAQLDVYVAAARSIYPDRRVEGVLLYAS